MSHEAMKEALVPFAAVADEYDKDGLAEARPHWIENGTQKFDLDRELYFGRGGKTLITLRHVMQARFVLTGKPYTQHDVRDVLEARKVFEALYIGGRTWQDLSDEVRSEYIAKVKTLRR